jgi:hypothetical protein
MVERVVKWRDVGDIIMAAVICTVVVSVIVLAVAGVMTVIDANMRQPSRLAWLQIEAQTIRTDALRSPYEQCILSCGKASRYITTGEDSCVVACQPYVELATGISVGNENVPKCLVVDRR